MVISNPSSSASEQRRTRRVASHVPSYLYGVFFAHAPFYRPRNPRSMPLWKLAERESRRRRDRAIRSVSSAVRIAAELGESVGEHPVDSEPSLHRADRGGVECRARLRFDFLNTETSGRCETEASGITWGTDSTATRRIRQRAGEEQRDAPDLTHRGVERGMLSPIPDRRAGSTGARMSESPCETKT